MKKQNGGVAGYMGWGHSYKCQNCDKSGDIYCDYGMAYPQDCEEVYEDAKNGRYGDAWRACIEKHPNGAFDCALEIYKCTACGFWKNDSRKNYFVGRNAFRIRKKYVTNVDRSVYWCIKRYRHICPRCNKVMHRADLKTELLHCLTCGNVLKIDFDQFLWD